MASTSTLWSADIPRLVGCNSLVFSEYDGTWLHPTIHTTTGIREIKLLNPDESDSRKVTLPNGYIVSVLGSGDFLVTEDSNASTTYKLCTIQVEVTSNGKTNIRHSAKTTLSIPVGKISSPIRNGSVYYGEVGRDYINITAPSNASITYPITAIMAGTVGSDSNDPWKCRYTYPMSGVGAARLSNGHYYAQAVSINDAVYRKDMDLIAILDPMIGSGPPKPMNEGMVIMYYPESSTSTDAGYPFYCANSKFTVRLSGSGREWLGSTQNGHSYKISRANKSNTWGLYHAYQSTPTAVPNWNIIARAATILDPANDAQNPPSSGWSNGAKVCGSAVIYNVVDRISNDMAKAYDYIGSSDQSYSGSWSISVSTHCIQYFQARDVYHPTFRHNGTKFASDDISGGACVSYDTVTGLYKAGIVTNHIYDDQSSSTDLVDMKPICGFGVLQSPVLAASIANSGGPQIFRDFVIGFNSGSSSVAGAGEAMGVGPGTGLSGYYMAIKSSTDVQAAQLYGWYYKHRHAPPYTGTSSDVMYGVNMNAGDHYQGILCQCEYHSLYDSLGPFGNIADRTYDEQKFDIDIRLGYNIAIDVGDTQPKSGGDIDLPICISSDDIILELKTGDTTIDVSLSACNAINKAEGFIIYKEYGYSGSNSKLERLAYMIFEDKSEITQAGDIPHNPGTTAGGGALSASIIPFTGPYGPPCPTESDKHNSMFVYASSMPPLISGSDSYGDIPVSLHMSYRHAYYDFSTSTYSSSSAEDTITGSMTIPDKSNPHPMECLVQGSKVCRHSQLPELFTPEPGATFSVQIDSRDFLAHPWYLETVQYDNIITAFDSTGVIKSKVVLYEIESIVPEIDPSTKQVVFKFTRWIVDPSDYSTSWSVAQTKPIDPGTLYPGGPIINATAYNVRHDSQYTTVNNSAVVVPIDQLDKRRVVYGQYDSWADVLRRVSDIKTREVEFTGLSNNDSRYTKDEYVTRFARRIIGPQANGQGTGAIMMLRNTDNIPNKSAWTKDGSGGYTCNTFYNNYCSDVIVDQYKESSSSTTGGTSP